MQTQPHSGELLVVFCESLNVPILDTVASRAVTVQGGYVSCIDVVVRTGAVGQLDLQASSDLQNWATIYTYGDTQLAQGFHSLQLGVGEQPLPSMPHMRALVTVLETSPADALVACSAKLLPRTY